MTTNNLKQNFFERDFLWYLLFFWFIMSILYYINYLPWIYDGTNLDEIFENGKYSKDPFYLALANVIVDGIFSLILFALFYKKIRETSNYFSNVKNLLIYLSAVIILSALNSYIYYVIFDLNKVLIEKEVIPIRNFPEAVLSMNLFIGFWFFYKRNLDLVSDKEKLEIDKARLIRRGRDHDYDNIFAYLSIFQGFGEEQYSTFLEQLNNYSRYLIYDRVTDKVKLETEVAHLKNYLELRTLKFSNNRLELKHNFQKEFTQGLEITPGILVEGIRNAIKHGEDEHKRLSIAVNVLEKAGELSFFIENGFSPNQNKPKNRYTPKSGRGLGYIEDCLKTYYPEKYEFQAEKVGDKFIFKIKLNLN